MPPPPASLYKRSPAEHMACRLLEPPPPGAALALRRPPPSPAPVAREAERGQRAPPAQRPSPPSVAFGLGCVPGEGRAGEVAVGLSCPARRQWQAAGKGAAATAAEDQPKAEMLGQGLVAGSSEKKRAPVRVSGMGASEEVVINPSLLFLLLWGASRTSM